MFPSSTKREMRHFHVVVVQRRQRNVQKKRDARAKLLFCQSKPIAFFFCRSRCRRCRRCLSSLMLHPRGHARALWVVSFPRCTAGPNNIHVGSSCIRLYTTANTDARTPNIVGPPILGVVRPFALSLTLPFLFRKPIRSHSSIGLTKVASGMNATSHGIPCPLISYPHPPLLLFDAAVAVFVVSRMSVELSSPTDPSLLGSTQ